MSSQVRPGQVGSVQERQIRIDKSKTMKVGGEVPQGSVIGPSLWNMLYDDVMKTEVPEVSFIWYAGDR